MRGPGAQGYLCKCLDEFEGNYPLALFGSKSKQELGCNHGGSYQGKFGIFEGKNALCPLFLGGQVLKLLHQFKIGARGVNSSLILSLTLTLHSQLQ